MKIILLILSFCTLTLGCKKEKKEDNNASFFSCKVDGVEWIPECSTCFYAFMAVDKLNFVIMATGINGTSISLEVHQNSSVTSKTYLLSSYDKNKGIYSDEPNKVSYETDDTHTGELKLDFDETNKTVSGEFYFNVTENHKITDGKFKVPIIN